MIYVVNVEERSLQLCSELNFSGIFNHALLYLYIFIMPTDPF